MERIDYDSLYLREKTDKILEVFFNMNEQMCCDNFIIERKQQNT